MYEHGCNTLVFEQYTTAKLKEAGALPIEQEKRITDDSAYLERLGKPTLPCSFKLHRGNASLFVPICHCHRRQPPGQAKVRGMLSFCILSASSFKKSACPSLFVI